ncbi:MAG TPA: SDR family oxidoreductase [Solirubrobacteraceae bacterium]|jgi:3-oxoacyl-[acyl-carrier protein] reductase
MNRLNGRSIVVTGAAGGIGRAVAERCAADGAVLVLVDAAPAVEELADELGAQALVGDVKDTGLAERALALADDQGGGLRGLANIAAVFHQATAEEMTDDEWERVLGVNLTAPMRWCRAAIPRLRARGGAIVNVTSIVASHARPRSVAYIAAKAGLAGLTRSIAIDFGREGIRCNSLAPGSIETPMLAGWKDSNPGGYQEQIDANFTGRLGRPEEIAAACSFLLSDESTFTNGTELVVDGGRLAGT